jgi:hypothetical protein
MEPLNTPLNDDELKQALRQWQAPNAPASLERRVLPQDPWWRWLLTGTVRIPVPALIATAVAVATVFAGLAADSNNPPISCAAFPEQEIVAIACDRTLAPPAQL